MTDEDREKAKLYEEFYRINGNKTLLESRRIEDNLEYFRRFKDFYERARCKIDGQVFDFSEAFEENY